MPMDCKLLCVEYTSASIVRTLSHRDENMKEQDVNLGGGSMELKERLATSILSLTSN